MTSVYRLGMALALVSFGACAILSPVKDPNPGPASVSEYAMESTACGVLGVHTAACVYQKGADLSHGGISVRIPITNSNKVPASVRFISTECNIDKTISGLPGQTVSVEFADMLSIQELGASCSIQIVLVPTWDGQSGLTFPISPLQGRALLLLLDHAPTSVLTASPNPVKGFFDYNQAPGQTASPYSGSIQIDSQGSALGQFVYAGCGLPPATQNYSIVNPTFNVPRVSSSCILFGTVQRVDASTPLSFAIAVNVMPTNYLPLAAPILSDDSTGTSDSYVSAMDFGTALTPGGEFTIPKEYIGVEYDLRQITTSGRFSISHVKNGQIVWSLP